MVMMFCGGIALFGVMHMAVRAPGAMLRKKFQAQGNMTGKSLEEIVAACGPFKSQSSLANGRTLYQWMATGYHIALIFENNKVLSISHESAV